MSSWTTNGLWLKERGRSNEEASLRRICVAALASGDDSGFDSLLRVLQPVDETGLHRIADVNDIVPMVAHALIEGSGRPNERWSRDHEASGRRTSLLMQALDQIAAALQKRGIAMVAMKNAGIARGIFPCAACCPMGDIDVLVERARFLEAHEVVQLLGYRFDSRSTVETADIDHALETGGGTEYRKKVDGTEVWLELQWRPIAGRWIRPEQEPDGAEMIRRSVPIAGTAVRLFSPEDNLIQVALHTAKHSFVRAPGLRLHTDVDRLVRFSPPDWRAVVDMVGRLEVRSAVYFSLAIPHALLSTPVPQWVLDELAPPQWKEKLVARWIRSADLFETGRRKFSRVGMMLFHALLYDDLRGLLASVTESQKQDVRFGNTLGLIRKGARRLTDLMVRFQA